MMYISIIFRKRIFLSEDLINLNKLCGISAGSSLFVKVSRLGVSHIKRVNPYMPI